MGRQTHRQFPPRLPWTIIVAGHTWTPARDQHTHNTVTHTTNKVKHTITTTTTNHRARARARTNWPPRNETVASETASGHWQPKSRRMVLRDRRASPHSWQPTRPKSEPKFGEMTRFRAQIHQIKWHAPECRSCIKKRKKDREKK